MIDSAARLLEQYLNFDHDRTVILLTRIVVAGAATAFILVATMIVSFENIFSVQVSMGSLQVGDLAPDDIYAPESRTYVSRVLTEQRREDARSRVEPIFDPPDPGIARQQIDLARQILDFTENIRRDPFASTEQRADDLRQIIALALNDITINQILEIDSETWPEVDNQIIAVLERVMREEIQASDLERVRSRLPTQVPVRFNDREAAVITSVVSDLVQPNTSLNEEATAAARDSAAAAVQDETRSFERGQIVVASRTRITPVDFEALEQLGLFQSDDRRFQGITQGLLASIIVMVVMGLYIGRFNPSLIYNEPRFLALLAAIFLIVLGGARLGLSGQIYIYPTAALGLLYVTISGAQIAVIGMIGLAILVGLMAGSSLEIALLVVVGGVIGSLTLRRAERLNSFFLAGLMVAASNVTVAALFNLNTPVTGASAELALLIIYSLLNGILTAAAAIAGLYIVTLLFNLPTALKLVELSQPNQPLMQRLLREAPGSYQHTLQVANLAEQAANAIGANAELTHVAALYHDIGKMNNPAFFTENQRDIGNPHDTLNDPYRSADIIISHVTGGDEMARQYRLPNRIRDFIKEHHGTSQVYVFYRQAVIMAGNDESQVDIADFSYPGPKPRSRETAILMLADSCEATIRSVQPGSKAEIAQVIEDVIEGKRKAGQLDESGLTLNDLKAIQNIFVDMLQAVFHPRINYAQAISRASGTQEKSAPADDAPINVPPENDESKPAAPPSGKKITGTTKSTPAPSPQPPAKATNAHTQTSENPVIPMEDDEDDAPLPEVPRLRRTGESPAVRAENDNADAESARKHNGADESDEADKTGAADEAGDTSATDASEAREDERDR